MRINRHNSHSSYQRRTRFSGCLSSVLMIALLMGGAFLGRDWMRQWVLRWTQSTPENITLRDTRLAFNDGNLDKTIQYASDLLDKNPDDTQALVMLVRALIYRSYSDIQNDVDLRRAVSLTQKAFDKNPLDNTITGIHAFTLQANDQAEEAQRIALRAIMRDRNSITARLALSLAYSQSGLFEAALREGQRSVEIATEFAPDWKADAYRVLAIAHRDLGDYQSASQAVEQAIEFNRRLIPLHFERALYALQIGDKDTATAYYFRVIAFDENNIKARFRLCELSSTLREMSAAIEYCTYVTENAPGWSNGWYRLGREYFLQGDLASAVAALGRCTTLQVAQGIPIAERRFECWYLQGQAAEVLGDCDRLVPLYAEFQAMRESADIPQTWVYPPEGPAICAEPLSIPDG